MKSITDQRSKREPDLQSLEMEYQPVYLMKEMLSKHSYNWSRELAELMFPRTEEEKKANPRNITNQRRVNNIAHGITKSSAARIDFLNCGKILLDGYEAKYHNARKVANTLMLGATA